MCFKWFSNWMHSRFKCFDRNLKAINSLLMFYNKQEIKKNKQIWVFQRLLSRFEFSPLSFGSLKREWNRIRSVLILVHSVTSVIRYENFVHSRVVKPRRVVCSWGCQDQHSWWVCWAKGSVFLEGINVTSLVVFVCNL